MSSLGQSLAQLFVALGDAIHAAYYYVLYLPIVNALIALEQVVRASIPTLPAYALAIVLLALLIQAVLTPVTRRQLRASMIMQGLAQQLQALQRRYKGQPQELMAAQQALYRTLGINPFTGCLPLLLQLPFLFVLNDVLRAVLLTRPGEMAAQHLARINSEIYPFIPRLDALPGTTFLWTNLATPDQLLILPILAALCAFLQLRLASQRGQRTANAALGPNRVVSTQQFIMPALTFAICLTIPSGVALYLALWMAANLLQQCFMPRAFPPADFAPDPGLVL